MKKIVILSAFLSPFRSGAEACAEEVPLHLADQFDFTIITGRYSRKLPKRDRLRSSQPHLSSFAIPVIRVGVGHPIDKWLFPFIAPFVVRKLQPDIIHAILETFAGLALLFCRYTWPKAKRVLTLQTTNRSFLKGPIIRSAHRVTAISKHLQKIVSNLGRNDVTVISNGIYYDAMQSLRQSNPKIPGRILFVGRLERMKGVDVLLSAFQKLLAESGAQNVVLHVAGDGSQRCALESFTEELHIADHVQFLGQLSTGEAYREFAEAEIFCGLSRSEALGNVFLEAQSAGCAVIATNVGGIPDVIQSDVTGILVPVDDAHAAHAALSQLFKDRALRERLAKAGIEHAAKYRWKPISDQYSAIYREISGN